MDYQLIAKVNGSIRVLKTPLGVQIWMKGKQIVGTDEKCAVCSDDIGERPFFVPMAGEQLTNAKERIHAACIRKLPLLPMIPNIYAIEEGKPNGEQQR